MWVLTLPVGMLGELQWLALEVKYVERVQAFYEAFLDLEVEQSTDGEVTLAAGDTDLVLRAPGNTPRGGLHTHYAAEVPAAKYDAWYDRLDEQFNLVEQTIDDARSLYFYDPAGNCVELGEREIGEKGVGSVFEVVFEVEHLDPAVAFYEGLGFEVVDRGEERARLTTGPLDVELWEPRLGIADARGGVHVGIGVAATDPAATVDPVRDDASAVTPVEGGLRVRDPDGHKLSLLTTDD
jgi:catechol 2,3-dioxygenase-like lactoylglutathione lyase family enzyme